MPTKTAVPVKADAGSVLETTSGAVNVVASWTQLFPFQYSITLALVKLGFAMLTLAETPELKASLLEMTEMS